MHDILERGDLDLLLRRFYRGAMTDELLGPVFAAVGMDLEAHLPVIASFWERVLLRTGSYDGRVMAVHRRVHDQRPLGQAHFARWLELWERSVREHFAGPVAERAVERARHMGGVMLRDVQGSAGHRPLLPVVGA